MQYNEFTKQTFFNKLEGIVIKRLDNILFVSYWDGGKDRNDNLKDYKYLSKLRNVLPASYKDLVIIVTTQDNIINLNKLMHENNSN